MDQIIKPKRLSLYKALKLGYLRNEKKQAKRLKRFGYVIDKELTGNGMERMVAYNPMTKKVLYVVNGSATDFKKYPKQFVKDWVGTNLAGIALGRLKKTRRYIQEKDIYDKLNNKYGNAKIVLAGHSLGGAVVGKVGRSDDQVYAVDPANINQKPRPNVLNLRTKGDIVSSLSRDTITLPNPKENEKHGYFQPHDISNIKPVPIFV